MLILIVSQNEDRLHRIQAAVQAAGFHTILARCLDKAWTKTDFFDFSGVVIDYELRNDFAASAFRQRFITLSLDQDASPDAVGIQLTSVFRQCSELVQ